MPARKALLVACALLLSLFAATPASAARLSSLTLSAGQLSPAFSRFTLSYTATVPATVSSITVTAVPVWFGATIRINGTVTASGTPSAPIALATGPNTITVAATAFGRTDTYTVVVTRQGSGTNTTPTIAITSPASGAIFNAGASITFAGTASDIEDGQISSSIRWTSSLNGQFGTGGSVPITTLSSGNHTITASVTDTGGTTATATISLRVDAAPTVSITSPANNSSFLEGASITFTGTASDAEDGSLSTSISWTSSINGALGTGASVTPPALPLGVHTITASVTDSRVVTRTATIRVTVTAPGGSATRPNVLLIVSDDVGAEATSLYPTLVGNSGAVPTPNIENLAARGLVFDNAWASPLCSPTRATFISGLYGNRTGVTNVGLTLPTSTDSLFKYIARESPASYGMGVFGKWHIGTTIQHVRDTGVPVFRGFVGGAVNSYFNWTAIDINGTSTNITTYSTTAITDWSIDFIRNHEVTRQEDPWFLYVPYNASHFPNQVPPSNLHSVNVGGLAPGTTSNTIPVYKAVIQAMDTEIGRLLSHVDLDKTVVIYMGDNGTPSNVKDSGTGVRGSKQSVYEGGVRVPLVVAGAGVTRTGREGALVVSSDLYATIAALTGIPVSQIHNSFSLIPLLTDGSATTGRTHAFTELCSGFSAQQAIRDPRYKLVYNSGSWGLYDLISDPLEATNLYNNAAYSAVRASLQAELATLKAAATAGCFP